MSRLPLPDNPPTISSSVFLNNIPQQIFWNTTPWQFPYVLEIFVCLEEISVHTNLPMYDSYTWALPSGLLHTHNKDVVIECPSHSLWLTEWGGSGETSENPSRKRVIRFRRPSCWSRSSHRSHRQEACLKLRVLHISLSISIGTFVPWLCVNFAENLEHSMRCLKHRMISVLDARCCARWCQVNPYKWTSPRFIWAFLYFPLCKSKVVSSTFCHNMCITPPPFAGGSDAQLMVRQSFVKTVSNLAQFCFLSDH